MKHHQQPLRSRTQAGFTLIEVLIAVLVLSIGLLGLAALQTSGLGMNHSAYLRSQATILAADMADRMRANRDALGAYDNSGGTPAAVGACGVPPGCSEAQLAQNDLAEWAADIAATLPNGVGVVCPDATPNDGDAAAPACTGAGPIYAVKIWWRDDRNRIDASRECDGTLSGDGTQCFVVSLHP